MTAQCFLNPVILSGGPTWVDAHIQWMQEMEEIITQSERLGTQGFIAYKEYFLKPLHTRNHTRMQAIVKNQGLDKLEKTKIIERQYEQFADMSVDAVRLGGFQFPPLLIIPLLALLLELGLAHTAYRRLP